MTRIDRHPARERSSVASIVALILILMALTACETTGGGYLSGASGEKRAENTSRDGDYSEAASIYIGLATDTTGAERDRLTLLAVEQWLNASDVARASSAFRDVPRPSERDLRQLWDTNSAALLLYSGNPDAALDILEPMSRESLSPRNRLRVEALRADAWIQKHDPLRAVELMIQRESWLNDRRSVEQNRLRLWQGLLLSDPQVLRASAALAMDVQAQGWLSLGSLATSTGQQGIGWSNGVVRWRNTYRNHPAMMILDDLNIADIELQDYPRQIALLLPLSGCAGG